jgi:hypothetical protein
MGGGEVRGVVFAASNAFVQEVHNGESDPMVASA